MKIKELNKKLVSGFLTLTFRRATLFALRFATINLILARILDPKTIGVFNIANSILAFFTFFSDIGLAAAIIQKKELEKDDLKTTFTIQVILSAIIVLVIWLSAPIFANFYSLKESGMWLIRALAFGFLLTSFKVLPSVLLERDLKFGPLVLIEIVETTVFCSILIWLSFSGLGINGFSYSIIAQSIAGVGLIYIIAPWKIAIGFSKNAARSLLNFGIPFQLNSVLALLKDRLVPLVIANMVGPLGIGYITWAQSIAFLPLEVMNIVIRITFPAFSRLQDDHFALKQIVEKSIFLTALFLYPVLFGLLAIAPSLVTHVVSAKWQPALPLIYFFSINTFWASLSTTFTNVLNSIGRIGTTLKLMIFWTVITWVLTPILTVHFGYLGVAIASAIIAFTSLIPIWIIKKIIKIEIFKNIWQSLLCSSVMGILVYFLAMFMAKNILSLLVVVVIGAIIYVALVTLIMRDKIAMVKKEFLDR